MLQTDLTPEQQQQLAILGKMATQSLQEQADQEWSDSAIPFATYLHHYLSPEQLEIH